jgi:N-methylhydantoinase A
VRIGIDIGGTFTDLVAATDEGIVVQKVSSTPSDPSEAFRSALSRIGHEVSEIRHGTTVATNAVLTRTGAVLGFITTRGFRHLLHLARQDRPSLYDLTIERKAPLVDASACAGVKERVGADGTVIDELDEADVRSVLEGLRGVEGLAVTLLHAYAAPAHERRVAELAAEVLGDVSVSLSSDVLPEFREYERASTTALNAYVQPVVASYLGRIASSVDARVGVMWSGGGVRGIAQTMARPVHTMFSGPAAGVLGAAWASGACGFGDLVTLDMGGTSADVALVDDGEPQIAEESSIDGLPFRTPSLDVISVGAGGGSIAWIDEGGALRVGPGSAGAVPGPASYGRGGVEATVTDAQVVLGYLGDEGLAGGELTLDVDAAREAVERLAVAASLGVVEAAEGILRVVRATMARAIRSVSIERGKDVRRYALVAFGGAGPLHATALARELDITTVIVPPAPGALAALGLLVASHRADASLSRPTVADRARDGELRSVLHELTERVLEDLRAESIAFADARISHHVDCRYEGQSHEIRVEVDGKPSFAKVADAFHEAHAARYGFDRRATPVECVTFRASALGPHADVTIAPPAGDLGTAIVTSRRVSGADVPSYPRASLTVGARLLGPAIVTELDSTTWLDDGCVAVVAPNGSLVVEVR